MMVRLTAVAGWNRIEYVMSSLIETDFVEQGFVYLCGSVVVVVAEAFVGALKRPLDCGL